jgi:hypothetical protein
VAHRAPPRAGLGGWRCTTLCLPARPQLCSLLRVHPAAGTVDWRKAGAVRPVPTEAGPACWVGVAADLPTPCRLNRRPGSAQRGACSALWPQHPARARARGRRRLLVRSCACCWGLERKGRFLLTTPAACAGPYEREVEVAVNAVRLACALCQKVQAGCVLCRQLARQRSLALTWAYPPQDHGARGAGPGHEGGPLAGDHG